MRSYRFTLFVLLLATLSPTMPACNAATHARSRVFMNFHWWWAKAGTTKLTNAHAINRWQWQPAALTQPPHHVPPILAKTPGWNAVVPGTDVFHGRVGFAWFQTTLSAVGKTQRILHFSSVDDNATVYLNGKFLLSHRGWNKSFNVPLDAPWKASGRNVITVLVQNTAGPGGIRGPVTLRTPLWAHASTISFGPPCWRPIQIPNDYIVDGKFSRHASRSHGYLPVYPAWYGRNFTIPASDQGKMLWLYFQGVYRHARVYVNGHRVGDYRGGYTGFRMNIASVVHMGGSNTLLVHVNPTRFEGWWYEGGGIYRNVWLIVTHHLHIAPFGAYIISHVSGPLIRRSTGAVAAADLTIQTTVVNNRTTAAVFTIRSVIFSPADKPVGTAISQEALPAGAQATFDQSVVLTKARLWSLHHTNLYRLHTLIQCKGALVDDKNTTFGIRTIDFNPQRGFFLNGKRVELKGVCNHQDFPAVGIGAPNNLWWWRVMMLKRELHANAYRTSHNPVAPAFYRACDHLGMLVMDENRHPVDTMSPKAYVGAPYKNLTALKFMILRDRNHPSIIMWSMCNEEWHIQGTPYGKKVFRYMMKTVHQYDRTRPITCAMNGGYPHGFTHVENLLGINYNPGAYARMHMLLPHLPIFGSETGSTCSDRGVLANNASAGLVSQYSMHPPWAELAWQAWRPIATQPFVAGGFNWTGFDYRGEPTPYAWPDINSHFGLLDICGFPKPVSFYYKAWWGRKPLVYISPQWNLPTSMLGKKVSVRCYSNCHRVELWLNSRKIGSKINQPDGYLQWHVTYQPGILEARGFDDDKLVATCHQRTTGPAAGLRLTNEWPAIRANGEDIAPVAVAVVDADRRVVCTAMNRVHFSVRGPGKIVGTANGDPACHEPDQAPWHRAFFGYCMVLVQAGRKPGNITLTATAKGLSTQTLIIHTKTLLFKRLKQGGGRR